MTDNPPRRAGSNGARRELRAASRAVVPSGGTRDPSPTDRRLALTTSEVARRLGVSLGTVRRWADSGHLPSYRTPGGQRRFSAEDVDDFVSSLERSGGRRNPRA